ncbi:unnamed protein product [Schistosoma rodhaini]|uniref:TPX2_importin domain-containing protein n=1 Tax=Schistosoma rodhaini TaxID=6188 RepID=A0A183RSD6_9TREM|nr:unnamed protein product [Schistosoma rodhaini]
MTEAETNGKDITVLNPGKLKKSSKRQNLPHLDLCPREKQSYLNSISRIHKGRLLKEIKKGQSNIKLPLPPRKIKFKPIRCKSASQSPTSPIHSSCCNSKHNGRFPSTAENRLVFNKNGSISVEKNKRTPHRDVHVDLLNLPPIPLNLKMTKSFSSNQVNFSCSFNSRITTITEKDLDLIIPQLIKRRSNSGSCCHVHCFSPYFENLSETSAHFAPVRTTSIHTLETLWCRKRQELQNRNSTEIKRTKMRAQQSIRSPSLYGPFTQPRTIFNDMEKRGLLQWSHSNPVSNYAELPVAY